METITIQKRICIHSRHLDQDLNEHILKVLSRITENECNKEVGYIVSIEKLVRIVHHEIGRVNSDNVFTVEFTARTLNPKRGMDVSGTVCMLYKDGIFLNIMDKQKMLIPATSIHSLIYNEDTDSYDSPECSIRVGDDVEAFITASQYNDGSFSCLGILKEL